MLSIVLLQSHNFLYRLIFVYEMLFVTSYTQNMTNLIAIVFAIHFASLSCPNIAGGGSGRVGGAEMPNGQSRSGPG